MTLSSNSTSGSVRYPAQQQARLHMLDRLTAPFPRPMGSQIDAHRRALAEDGDFYARLAVWQLQRGYGRPEPMVAVLMAATTGEHREVGFALFQELNPCQGSRVMKILKRHLGKVPRSARAAVIRRLRRLEEQPEAFDRAVMSSRRSLKHLYASLHIKPSDRADRILFKGEPVPALEPTPIESVRAINEPDTELRIRRDTALLVDKSAGMEDALRVGQDLAGAMASRLDAALHVYTFDLVPYLVQPRSATPQGTDEDLWIDAFRHYRAAGAMSAGSVLEAMRQKRQRVEQLVVVTGKDENSLPHFHQVYADYAATVRTHPEVYVVLTHADAGVWVDRLAAAGIPVESGAGEERDLWPFLSRPSRWDLLQEILSVPLPSRQAA